MIYKWFSMWGLKYYDQKVKHFWYYYLRGDIWSPQCRVYQDHTLTHAHTFLSYLSDITLHSIVFIYSYSYKY